MPSTDSNAPLIDIFPTDCIFCGKGGKRNVKKGSSWTTESLSKFEYGGGATILETAENSNGYAMLRTIKGYDLFACEAQYHRICRKEYIRKPTTVNQFIFGSDFFLRYSREERISENKSSQKCPCRHLLHCSYIAQICSPRK